MSNSIKKTGIPKIKSPIYNLSKSNLVKYVSDERKIYFKVDSENNNGIGLPEYFEAAGPREKIYFDPLKTKCAIVTCGGLCPGLNDIIRGIVLELYFRYGVKKILGIRHGLQGFISSYMHETVELTPSYVERIIDLGGSVLGSSRGEQDMDRIISFLENHKIQILFMIGGDGTLKAAHKLASRIIEKKTEISIIGIPKTIDNDIVVTDKSFGFETAVDEATRALRAAHNEATGFPNGIGIVKLMGRHSGFIAATAALAQQDANFVLIPEVRFEMDGEGGLLLGIEKRLNARKHAVIVVAEGAGQEFFKNCDFSRDKSGNIILHDIGLYLKSRIENYFKEKNINFSIKYIDPSYMIRSLPANSNDSVFCGFLARNAVHAGMSGKTDMLVGHLNNRFIHIPMELCAGKRKKINPEGELWQAVLEATGQGDLLL
ncbi:MAG: diphosphate--fructose-6-phosphate 1-phosphotransferase [Deltaproteobacteria bacterium]|nr:MAG: diphosphate--fructose-6-phosphate 1-phosphotransferase [Deltaproteobacteria bacterium]